jgi:hypothetical protein
MQVTASRAPRNVQRAPRASGQVAMATIAGVILAVSALLCALVAWGSFRFAYEATCGPTPPVEWRLDILYVGLGAYALLAIPTVILISIGRTAGLVVAIILACCALAPPALSYVFAILSSAMC